MRGSGTYWFTVIRTPETQVSGVFVFWGMRTACHA
jgi:hypothetical protein